ncbi:hypothetical protein BT96DRAFT_913659 [Gymnopus androsaceus JB14]|uniref:Uncharacterized protein n=1 Tax=Gymnopus androsaceus JB14 TaxID=1447944 RepID=A0A6A4IA21_9AGAR|nr:hypothetical protein BT96DRAFT_913659 [Gymnopus androsaceus JB14]
MRDEGRKLKKKLAEDGLRLGEWVTIPDLREETSRPAAPPAPVLEQMRENARLAGPVDSDSE